MTDEPIDLDSYRKKTGQAAVLEIPQSLLERTRIQGPFRLTIYGPDGVPMWDVPFADDSGDVPIDCPVLATGGPGARELIVNLLSGALKVFAGGI